MATASSSNNPTPSQLGRYRIVREIARSNDIVYEAIDPTMNRRVALKELNLPPNLPGQQRRERLERFYREAKAAGTLNHRHIVTIYEIGQEKDRHFIAMEFLDGQSLRDYINVNGPLPIKLALQIGLDLCDALGYAHSQGVVHRDVKPDNVHLVPPGHTAKLTDFGIARVMEEPSLTTAGQVFGTPSYMSPEQLMARNVDHRTDLFSLGVMLYEIITGKKPFAGDNIQTITYAIVNSPVSFPQGTPAGITGILRRALAKDPEQRYPNAQAMAADIRMEMSFQGSQYPYLAAAGYPAEENAAPVKTTQTAAKEAAAAAAEAAAAETAPPDATLVAPAVPPPSAAAPDSTVAEDTPPQKAVAPPVKPPVSEITEATAPVAPPDKFHPQPSTYYAPVQQADNPVVTLVLSVGAIVALVAMVVFTIATTVHNTKIANDRAKAITYYNAGSSAMDGGDPQSAAADYSKAIAICPPDDTMIRNARSNLALAYIALGDQASTSDPGAAMTYYKKALASAEHNASVHFKIAQICTDPAEALREYEKAIAGDPAGKTGADARRLAANLYLSQGDAALDGHDLAGARSDYNRVIVLAPTDPVAQQARQRLTSAGL
ncbi:MAG: serine/threonine-protein kinase [Capsulimonadaceae bacterium]|nr:serine/threonine-protein kinase [Capsulimonadaceae bacterium]